MDRWDVTRTDSATAKPRKCNVTTALRAYAALTTSAARGAVRDVDQLNRRG